MMSIPQNAPMRPKTPPVPPAKNVNTAPIAPVIRPAIIMTMPPMIDRTNAPVGLSPAKS